MAKRPCTVIVRIPWEKGVVERVRLDLPALIKDPKKVLQTLEYRDDSGVVTYQPCATYRKDSDANHVIQLEYRKQEHPHLEGCEVYWGVATITVNKALTGAMANWKGEPAIKGMDGDEECKLSIEQPSKMRRAATRVREAQTAFKKELLKLGAECAITEERLRSLLDAAHIHAVEDGGSDVLDNGILLRADLHRLFDDGYFIIEPDGSLKLHRAIPHAYAQLLKGKRLKKHVIDRIRPYLARRKRLSPG